MKKATVVVLLALVAGIGAGCGLLDSEVATAEVGECISNDLTTPGGISEFETVSCDEPHSAELYFKFDLPDGDFPGAEEVSSQATERCQGEEFESYVGTPYAESEIFSAPIFPTEQSWNDADDREVLCFGVLSGGEDLDESIKGSGR